MSSPDRVVIVGASLGGATTALTLRELGYQGDVVLVGDERDLPYERPALSKEYLLGTMSAEQLHVREPDTYADLGIDLRLGVRATALLPAARQVILDHGDPLTYSALVIATGAANVRPLIPGIELPGVCQLRTLPEATALRAAAAKARRAVVVGMGFIGCEIAATLRELDLEVSAVDSLGGPLLPQLGSELNDRVRSWHEEHGVRMLFGSSVTAITRVASRLSVATWSGEILDADLVVVGVGVRPNVLWLENTPLHSAAGVAVDDDGRAGVPDVYAVGDVAAKRDARTGARRRTEHWSNAIDDGRSVAHAIVGLDPPSRTAPYFWSAQYGHYVQYVGQHSPGAPLVLRDYGGRLTGFFVEGDVVRAAVTIDNGRELRHVRGLLDRSVEVADLANPSVDVRTLGARLSA